MENMRRKKLTPKNPNNKTLKAYSKAVKRGSKSLHVVSHDNGWVVKKVGAKRVDRVFDTQKEAGVYAKRHRVRGTNVFLHKRDGSIGRAI